MSREKCQFGGRAKAPEVCCQGSFGPGLFHAAHRYGAPGFRALYRIFYNFYAMLCALRLHLEQPFLS